MNKKDFMKNLNAELEGMPLNRQIELLQKIQNVWLTEMINARKKKEGTWVEPEKKDQYFYCHECKKYTLKTKCKTENVHEVRTETTYTDSGYGDEDRMGDVEYLVEYITCPRCGHRQEKGKIYLKIKCEWLSKFGRERGRVK